MKNSIALLVALFSLSAFAVDNTVQSPAQATSNAPSKVVKHKNKKNKKNVKKAPSQTAASSSNSGVPVTPAQQ